MCVDAVDIFSLRMPEVLDIGDGSQDATLVRIAVGHIGWRQWERSPLGGIAVPRPDRLSLFAPAASVRGVPHQRDVIAGR